jgi:proton-dependent oligopeptide transporter, POT family
MSYNGTEYQLTLDGRGGDANQLVVSAQGSSTISFSEGATAMLVADPAAVGLPASIPAADYTLRVETEEFYQNVMYLSLALIIAGVGFLKANISTIVGALYGFGDTRRDSGFTIFYMGINMGAFLSSILCGYLGIAFGWKYGFGLAGFGMVFGLVTFLKYQHWLEGRAEPPSLTKLKEKVLGPINVEQLCYLSGLAIIVISMILVMNAHLVDEDYVGWLGILIFGVLVGYSFVKCASSNVPVKSVIACWPRSISSWRRSRSGPCSSRLVLRSISSPTGWSIAPCWASVSRLRYSSL